MWNTNFINDSFLTVLRFMSCNTTLNISAYDLCHDIVQCFADIQLKRDPRNCTGLLILYKVIQFFFIIMRIHYQFLISFARNTSFGQLGFTFSHNLDVIDKFELTLNSNFIIGLSVVQTIVSK